VSDTPTSNSLTLRSITWRSIGSILLFGVYGFVNGLVYPVATLAAGKVAGRQFESNDGSYLVSTYGMNFFGHVGWPFWAFLILLGMIWIAPARALIRQIAKAATAGLAILVIASPMTADAYYDKTDWPEIYYILPNESAFWIPDVGDNKTDQKKFMSEEYLDTNKIAAKRFQIPHVQLPKSSWTLDYYVPAGRLIIVDRTPYSRQWTADPVSGSSATNESLRCQSADGIDITVGIAISASVFEKDAPRFLYRFGVKPPIGDRNTPEVKFSSIYYGKSLVEVMDTVVRGKIQSLICERFSPKTLDQVNAQATNIIADSEKVVKEYLLTEFGITLDYIGWGDTFEFQADVQKGINDRYVAEKVGPVMATLERQAQIEIQRAAAQAIVAFGKGIESKGLPSNLVVLPGGLGDAFSALAGGVAAGMGLSSKPATANRTAPATVPQQP
jgi:SPFH domain / Band 7 family